MKVVIATSSQTGPDGVSVAKEAERGRAAIRYADEIELVSPAAVMLSGVTQLAAGDERSLLTLLSSFDGAALERLGGGVCPESPQIVTGVMADTAMDAKTLSAFLDPTSMRRCSTRFGRSAEAWPSTTRSSARPPRDARAVRR